MADQGKKIKLTYFDIEGAAEKVRLALVLNDVEFEDERVSGEQWVELKPKTKFGQLPMMRWGDMEFAQSNAMLEFAGRSGTGACFPRDSEETQIRIAEARGYVGDIAKMWMPSFYLGMRPQLFGYPEGFNTTEEGKAKVKEMREKFVAESVPQIGAKLSAMIEATGGYIATKDEPTIADCELLPTLRSFQKGHIDYVPTTVWDAYPTVTAYISRMMSHPKVQAWYAAKA